MSAMSARQKVIAVLVSLGMLVALSSPASARGTAALTLTASSKNVAFHGIVTLVATVAPAVAGQEISIVDASGAGARVRDDGIRRHVLHRRAPGGEHRRARIVARRGQRAGVGGRAAARDAHVGRRPLVRRRHGPRDVQARASGSPGDGRAAASRRRRVDEAGGHGRERPVQGDVRRAAGRQLSRPRRAGRARPAAGTRGDRAVRHAAAGPRVGRARHLRLAARAPARPAALPPGRRRRRVRLPDRRRGDGVPEGPGDGAHPDRRRGHVARARRAEDVRAARSERRRTTSRSTRRDRCSSPSGTARPRTSSTCRPASRRRPPGTARSTSTRSWRGSARSACTTRASSTGSARSTGGPTSPTYAASHGCVRIPYWVTLWMFDQDPIGTPVLIYH